MNRTLSQIANKVSVCTKCQLYKTRKCAVVGSGSHSSRIMFIGEAPGKKEDLSGRPFSGVAGKKLDEALESAGLARDDAYVTNVVKCRPPENRVPTDDERLACSDYLHSEIKLLNPELVCVMGNTALYSVLGKSGITENRGLVKIQNGVMYYATIHPAATIYNRKLAPILKNDIAQAVRAAELKPLPRLFYCRDTVTVAKELLGKKLIRKYRGRIVSGIITETEAYGHANDEASHAYSGMTERNHAMFGQQGMAYVYFTYGMHYCFNIVARANSAKAGAVLVRAIMPLKGIDSMRRARKIGKSSPNVADGPAKLAQAMHITKSQYGADLAKSGEIYITNGLDVHDMKSSKRIGVSRGAAKRWNFTFHPLPLVSREQHA